MASHPAIIGRRRLDTESLRVGKQFLVGMAVPVEGDFEWTNTLSPESTVFWGVWPRKFTWDSIGTVCSVFMAGHRPPT